MASTAGIVAHGSYVSLYRRLQSFGHPIGASGLCMIYETWRQLHGEAGPRQIDRPQLGLTHDLGGMPGRCVSVVSIVGPQ